MLFGKNKDPAPTVAPQGAYVFDVSEADFEQRVLMASMQTPVIVDFWAPWCGPCKQLIPALEAAVNATNGAVLMAKINVDENQQIAAALKIQSIPTVFAFFQGRPVDAFQGAQPDSAIKKFVEKLVHIAKQSAPDAIDVPEALKAAAQALAEKDFGTAQGIYTHILHQDEKNAQAYVGLVRTLIGAGAVDQAQHLVETAPPEIAKQNTFAEAKTALELAQQKPGGNSGVLAQKVAQNPADHQARFDLALAQFAEGHKEEAIDNLIDIVRQSRAWNEDGARKQIVKFFEAMGSADPITVQGRKKLSSVLFS